MLTALSTVASVRPINRPQRRFDQAPACQNNNKFTEYSELQQFFIGLKSAPDGPDDRGGEGSARIAGEMLDE